MIKRVAFMALPALAILLMACSRETCDDSWLWKWEKADQLLACAKDGHQGAQVRYGKLLALAGDKAESDAWLAKAIAGREAKGSLEVARGFAAYDGNPQLAEQWFRRAEALGEWEAAIQLGLLREKGGDHAAANRWFEQAAARGGPMAVRQIAFLTSHRPQTASLSTNWSKRGAELGDLPSMTAYAQRLGKGKGIAKDEPQSFRWLSAAASHPDAAGYDLLALARAHDDGFGTPRDAKAALAALRQARGRYIDSSDSQTPRVMEKMEARLVAELSNG